MRILANENVLGSAIAALRGRGYDVLSVKESMQSASDEQVLERARVDQRILITFDKDFGELAFHRRLPNTSGINPLPANRWDTAGRERSRHRRARESSRLGRPLLDRNRHSDSDASVVAIGGPSGECIVRKRVS